MAAGGAYEPAWFETDAESPQTYFSKYMADLVEAGMPGQPAGLRLHPMFIQLRENLARDHLPQPVDRSVDAARDFVFAHNAAPPETHVDKDHELRTLKARLTQMELDAAARQTELAQLQEEARSVKAMSAGQERLLAAALKEADRKTMVAASAQATAEAEYREAAIAAEEEAEASASPVLAGTDEKVEPSDDQRVSSPASRGNAEAFIISSADADEHVASGLGRVASTDHHVTDAPERASKARDIAKPGAARRARLLLAAGLAVALAVGASTYFYLNAGQRPAGHADAPTTTPAATQTSRPSAAPTPTGRWGHIPMTLS